ncbi:helix-turn-helix transcriptional regulator [Nocardioides sp.]|uniref:helix-turn-helix transcriptional regulator n=1 Tax=Nocardioides sp. TaxID=35761 RepID=UPI0039C9CA95
MEPTNGVESNATVVHGALEQAWSLKEPAKRLQVSCQTIYDLRSQGRGPRNFRVGRELRFRASEVGAWLARLEAEDADRHRAVDRR